MSFKENLRTIRTDRGMTQKALGANLGVTSVTIGNWERGVRQPSFDLLIRLANILKTSTDDLLGRHSTTVVSLDADALLKKFVALDDHGRDLVKTVCTMEYERIHQRANVIQFPEQADTPRTSGHRFLPKYFSPPAAGLGVPLEGEDFEMIRVDDTTPDEADYAVCISGDSMEPYIQDGALVFVQETEDLDDGDVGIFCVNGEMYCKQYHLDEDRNLHLISANPRRASASIYVSKDSGYNVRCCGKVLGVDVPLPE